MAFLFGALGGAGGGRKNCLKEEPLEFFMGNLPRGGFLIIAWDLCGAKVVGFVGCLGLWTGGLFFKEAGQRKGLFGGLSFFSFSTF